MSQPITSPTLLEAEEAGFTVNRNGEAVPVTAEMIRVMPKDGLGALARAFPESKLVTLFEEMMEATCVTNGGKVIPDNRTRLAARIYVANQVLGTPIQRQQIEQTIINRSEEENMRTLQSPAMLAAMKNLIARVEGKAE
jgi:hypothetical protein